MAVIVLMLFIASGEPDSRSRQTSSVYLHTFVGTVESVDALSNTLVVSAEDRGESEFPEDPVKFTIDRSNAVVDNFKTGDSVRIRYLWPCGPEGDRRGVTVGPA